MEVVDVADVQKDSRDLLGRQNVHLEGVVGFETVLELVQHTQALLHVKLLALKKCICSVLRADLCEVWDLQVAKHTI